MNNIIRVPRPIGTSELGKQFSITNDDQHYKDLLNNVIHSYVRNNFSYCGRYMNIEQFSHFTNINMATLQKGIMSYGNQLGDITKEMLGGGTMNDTVRALKFLTINWGLEDRSKAQQQLTLLLSSQGAKYTPFISGEVNKAIKLVMDSTAQMLTVVKSIVPQGSNSQGPFIDADYNENNPNEMSSGITIDEAVRFLKQENVTPLKDDTNAQEALYLEYNIEDTPEVNALQQTGLDISKEGLGLKELTKLSDKQMEALVIKKKIAKKDKHMNRRADEIGFDFDSDQV